MEVHNMIGSCYNACGWMPTNPDWGLHLVFYTECNPQTFERVFLCILQFARETCWPLVFLSDFLVCGKSRLEVNKLYCAVSKECVNPWDRPFWALFPKLSLSLICLSFMDHEGLNIGSSNFEREKSWRTEHWKFKIFERWCSNIKSIGVCFGNLKRL